MPDLKNKFALVTGSSKGIGAAIAKQLAADGATVAVNYASSKADGDKVAAEITAAGGKAIVLGGSVAVPAERDALFAEIKKQFGSLDILVNNAGIYEMAPLDQSTEESFDKQFGVNVKGLLFTTKAALPLFPATGASVINIGSIVGEQTPAASAIYSGTKGAVDSITRVLSRELGPKKIRVNAVNPGPVDTEGTAGFTEFFNAMLPQTPLGRTGKPSDIASAVAFLASDESVWITGSLLQAAGGLR